jgi:hypothetical protein
MPGDGDAGLRDNVLPSSAELEKSPQCPSEADTVFALTDTENE